MAKLPPSWPTFLYQAYGSAQFRKQAQLSILSLLAQGVPPEQVCVFTDEAADFTSMSLNVLPATKAQIKQWQRPYCHPHRLKIELIRHVFQSANSSVLYLDSDTVWLQNPERIVGLLADGKSLMHEREGRLSDNFFPAFRAELKNPALLRKIGLRPEQLPSEIRMYNAGVVGVPKDFDASIFERACRLCDLMSVQVPSKMEWAEQLAFSLLLEIAGPIENCKSEILHYWRDSFEISRAIKSFSPAELQDLSWNPAQIEQLVAEARHVKRTALNQLMARAKRLRRSWKKRTREVFAIVERLKQRREPPPSEMENPMENAKAA